MTLVTETCVRQVSGLCRFVATQAVLVPYAAWGEAGRTSEAYTATVLAEVVGGGEDGAANYEFSLKPCSNAAVVAQADGKVWGTTRPSRFLGRRSPAKWNTESTG